MSELVVCSGSRMVPLVEGVVRELGVRKPPFALAHFPDGEVHVELDGSVARSEVFIVQSLAPPIGEAAIELLLLADGAWRAGALSVTAVIPYLGYARQDRCTAEGQPLGAKVLGRMIDTGRFTRVVTLDLHAPAVAGHFDAAVEHLTAAPLLVDAMRSLVVADSVVVSPDLGGVKLAERYARALGLPLAVVHKQRLSGSEVKVHGVAGDVEGRMPIIVDDMIATGATLVAAIDALHLRGCVGRPLIAVTHALLAGPAAQHLLALEPKAVFATDSVPHDALAPAVLAVLDVVGLAPLLAQAIRRLHRREPLGALLSHL